MSPPPSPTIYRLAANREYESIPSRLARHPKDLYWTDRYGSTALHIICQAAHWGPSVVRAVDAMVHVAPELVGWPNAATWTPLHFAVEERYAEESNVAIVLRLIRACPRAVSVPTKRGYRTKTPFHIACEANSDYRILERMLEIDPSLATKNFAQADPYAAVENPLQLLWNHHRRHGEYTEEKMALLLRATQIQLGDDTNKVSLLAAACTVRCPRGYFQLVVSQEDSLASDDKGNQPLHYAVRRSDAHTQWVVKELVQAFPHQQAPNQRRLWPLHVALDRQWTWHEGVSALVQDAPQALRIAHPETCLYPFQSAAVYTQSRLHLSTIFELLLAAPDIILSNREKRQTSKKPSEKVDAPNGLGVFEIVSSDDQTFQF